jgi:hypothetical protein
MKLFSLLLVSLSLCAQQVAPNVPRTVVSDTMRDLSGQVLNGSILTTLNDPQFIFVRKIDVAIGVFSISLYPGNYAVVIHSSTFNQDRTETWVVPNSGITQTLANVGSSSANIKGAVAGSANIVAQIQGPATNTSAIDITAFSLTATTINALMVGCWTGTGFSNGQVMGDLTPIACSITSRSTTSIIVTFSNSSNILVVVNSIGGTPEPTSYTVTGTWLSYNVGSVSATNGTATVTGAGTSWTSDMAGRWLMLSGTTKQYKVVTVDAINQVLTTYDNFDIDISAGSSYSLTQPILVLAATHGLNSANIDATCKNSDGGTNADVMVGTLVDASKNVEVVLYGAFTGSCTLRR